MSLQYNVIPPPTYVPNRSAAIARLGWETKSSDSLGLYALIALLSATVPSAGNPGVGSLINAATPAGRSICGNIAADGGKPFMGPPPSAPTASLSRIPQPPPVQKRNAALGV